MCVCRGGGTDRGGLSGGVGGGGAYVAASVTLSVNKSWAQGLNRALFSHSNTARKHFHSADKVEAECVWWHAGAAKPLSLSVCVCIP